VRQSETLLFSVEPGGQPAQDFEDFFFEHYARLVRVLLRLLGNPSQAEELAADAFFRFHRHRPEIRSAENPAGWLYRTAFNLGLDALRTDARRRHREESAMRESPANNRAGDPLFRILAEEKRERVRTALARLKPVQAQVLLLANSGFTCPEIAAMLTLRSDSLYTLISRARAQFEKEYLNLYGRTE
jgi:RNA polymerase sigma-70 factor (ECF subfamily)